MLFQGSGFSVELPANTHDASSYTFVFPALGDFPPSIVVRFEAAQALDLAARMQEVQQMVLERYPHPRLDSNGKTMTRGEWEYFTHVLEFGDEDMRMTQKEVYILIKSPAPTLYMLTGVDRTENFKAFEPTYDEFVRTFQPNDVQRL